MAGNVQADNSGNIFVEFDYNNIIVVDPNKTQDPVTKKIRERLVDHENLVMYANLEAEVLPRTKLAVGVSPEDRVRIVSIAKMNFLKPTKDAFLGTGYYDELTGENTTKFRGVNQMMQQAVVPKDGSKPYIVDRPSDLTNIFDNGLLGITNIQIDTNLSFIPTVRISLEDVQGRALFQLGNNSPYAAFFNLPYPPFYLTLKGYYGQAVRYQLNLEKFNARFNSFSGNYQIELDFKGYKFNILNEVAVGHLLATPHMYSQQFNVTTNPVGPQTDVKSQENNAATQGKIRNVNDGRQTEETVQITSERGYQKIKEVYSEYKSKGLIAPDFPEYSLPQFINALELFEINVANQFEKVEVEPLTNIRNYKAVLTNYFQGVRGGQTSWFNRYLNPNPIVQKDKKRLYVYKEIDLRAKNEATGQLESLITDYNKQLSENPTLGIKGPTPIPNPIRTETIIIKNPPSSDDIDWTATTTAQTGIIKPTVEQVTQTENQFQGLLKPLYENRQVDGKTTIVQVNPPFFTFEGQNGFDKEIALMETTANKKLSEFEDVLTKKLLEKIESGTTGIGFKPTVRNIIAVLMASAEAFIRLLDDVHTTAWDLKYDDVRKKAILENPSSAPGSDTVDELKKTKEAIESSTGLRYSEIPVYPWPQFFVETPEDKKGRFQLKYVADPTVVELTGGWDYSKWPEVQFVEEYMRGLTMKFNPPLQPPPLDNENDTNLININAIEFPTTGVAYVNKEEIKFFYEIYERQLVTSRYSNYVRANANQVSELIKLNTETEVNNVLTSLGLNTPYITMKLKNYGLNSGNYLSVLENISNQGTGRAWQDFIRDFFVTPYIRNLTENSFSILDIDEYGKTPQTTAKSTALESLAKNSTNEPNITDTIPFTNNLWVQSNMANGISNQGIEVYNTNKVLSIFEPRRIISNFNSIYNYTENRPVTNFSYLKIDNPYAEASDYTNNFIGLRAFYIPRTPNDFMATEGYIASVAPNLNAVNPLDQQFPLVSTTSMLNTPYMVNAIQNGVQNQKTNDPYPYVQAGYFFINSMPLASLKEKYKTRLDGVQTDLDYIASCFKKFGAIHKLPYAWILKIGSVWHRYKVHRQTGGDILSTAWNNFDYVSNYSPILNVESQTYSFNYGTEKRQISLKTETTTDVSIQSGFYPKVINDFYQFCNGYEVYKDYNDVEIQKTINGGMKVFNYVDSNIDALEGLKNLRLKTWSVLIPGGLDISEASCSTTPPTKKNIYFIVPSFGSSINQTIDTCLTNLDSKPETVVNISSNPAMYNGTVRCLWSAPNYGYFDNSSVVVTPPDAYINKIRTDIADQSPFFLLDSDEYSKIEEIFSVFDRKILDAFEQEFLNFCKPITNIEIKQSNQIGASSVSTVSNFRNFQALFKNLMTVIPQLPTTNEEEYFNEVVIPFQYANVQNTLRAFMEYDVLFKYGNPSNYKRRIVDSYISYLGTATVVDPINFGPYVQNSLPTLGNTVSLQQSRAQNPLAWLELELEVGFSTIPNVRYSSQGSYITDFFVDNNIAFTVENIQLLSPLIKMFATYKLNNPNNTVAQFKNVLRDYLNQENLLQTNFLNDLLARLNKDLPNQSQIPQGTVNSVISGQQSKVENWEVFKALNDKWIAGGDYKTKTLFEDILFLDRASRNIGETVLIDIFDLRGMIGRDSLNSAMSVFTLISGILIKNNFTVMNLPAYVNFYNVQEVDGTTIQKPEGSLEFANNMWGTFLNVDYRNATPKMVCFYVGKPSQYLDLPKGNFRFRDDGFEMRRASENPLIENQDGKKDWAVSNKCVGFNVDIGTRNQNIFYSFQVEQSGGVATSESINTQLNMINQASGRNVATQNVSLYNLYKQRSYKCSVVCLGNALIQPSMYFNLRHVPMFNGPYMIQTINHSIQPGSFQTTFQGVRQGIYDLPAIDSFLQSMNQNLLTKLEEILKIKKNPPKAIANTQQQKVEETVQKSETSLDAQNGCTNKVDVITYQGYEVQAGNKSTLTPMNFKAVLDRLLPGDNNRNLRFYIYGISYVNSFVQSSNSDAGTFVGYNNNFALISLDKNFGQGLRSFFNKRYCCVNVTTQAGNSLDRATNSLPISAFNSVDDYVKFMAASLTENLTRIQRLGLTKYYVCYWPKQNVAESYFDLNARTEFETVIGSMQQAYMSAVSIGMIPKAEAEANQKKSEEQSNNSGTSGTSGTSGLSGTSGTSGTSGQSCPPPVIDGFAPTIGNSGTIIRITGRNLDTFKEVFINGVQVEPSKIQALNAQSLTVVVPNIGTVASTGNIKVTTFYGTFTTVSTFKFDPSIEPSAPSSPGSLVNNASGTEAAATAVVSNPQDTGPNPLEITTQTTTSTGGDEQLTVQVTPNTGPWEIQSQPTLTYTFYTIQRGSNNTITKTVEGRQTKSIVGFVSQDRKTFNITRQSLIDAEFEGEIEDYQGEELEFNTQIKVLAVNTATQETVQQNYNFVIYVPPSTPTTQTPPGSLVIVSNTDSGDLPNFSGPDIYNIKKPAGGYITLQFSCANLIQKGEFELVLIPEIEIQAITITNNPSTKYTNLVETSAKGRFQASVRYKSSSYTHTFPNTSEPVPINAGATSPPFTL